MTNNKTTVRDMRIAIVGAGPAGLAAAIALKKQRFKNVVLFERDAASDARLQGYSFMLFAPKGGLAYLEELGLAAEIDKISFDPTGFRFVDAETATDLMSFNTRSNYSHTGNSRAKRVMRAKLRLLLLEVAQREGVDLVWNARILKCEQPEASSVVKITFENGDVREFDLVIGADGGNSVVRKSLTGDEPVYTGYTAFLGNTTRDACPEAFEGNWFDRSIVLAAGKGFSVFGCHHPPSEIFWAFTMESPKGALAHLAGDKQRLKEEILKRAQAGQANDKLTRIVENGEVLNLVEYHDITPKPLSLVGRLTQRRDGRITLIGDAAHLMVPFRAQGGNNALLDARHLTGNLIALADEQEKLQLSSSSSPAEQQEKLSAALSEYEAEMTLRTAKEVLESRQTMHSIHETNAFKIFARNRMFGLIHWVANTSPAERFLVKTAVVGVFAGIALGVYSRATGSSVSEVVTRGVNLVASRFRPSIESATTTTST